MPAAAPAALAALRTRLAELSDIEGAAAVLNWDQNTYMPRAGHASRADQLATLERLAHEQLVAPELGRLLDELEPWVAGEDPDGDAARLVAVARRDHEKAVAVPERLAVAMARESAAGYTAWVAARESGTFAGVRDQYARQIELRHEYAACFPDAAHPYDVLLDDFEPGMTLAEARPVFDVLAAALPPMVAAAAPVANVLVGDIPIAGQRALVEEVLPLLGFDDAIWRLDDTVHPFAQSCGAGDVRITTRWADGDLGNSFYSVLHEFGHGLYEASFDPALARSPLHAAASLAVHESQSRTWENLVGRSRAFAGWVLPRLQHHLPAAFGALDAEGLFRGLNRVEPTLIRVEADETTYNLHVALRLGLEVALLEGTLEVADLPDAWNEGIAQLLGIEVPSDREGVLQDVHWAAGMFGYFPTYTLGNVVAAQLWRQVEADLPTVDAQIAAGDFAPLREWLRTNVHRHGRKFSQRELLRRVTGAELDPQPLLDYLGTKLRAAGVLTS